jgi:hypothetical protein
MTRLNCVKSFTLGKLNDPIVLLFCNTSCTMFKYCTGFFLGKNGTTIQCK